MNLIDLRRAQAEKAKCCVVLSNQFCKNTQLEDYTNILHAFAVKKFARIQMEREIRLCL